MAFPTINFKATNVELEEALVDILEKKLHTLEHFVGDAACVCDAEFEKAAPHKSGDVFRVEVNLSIDGRLYRADATMASFEQAIDEVRAELDKELSRDRDKHKTLVRDGGRKIKEMMRGEGEV